jgi:hypothetical protein
MPYVRRDDHGKIVSLKRENDIEHAEFLAPTHIDIVDFLTSPANTHADTEAKETLSESDQAFTRVTEDLIHLLIQKNMILFTELPPEVQAKMAGREKLRSNLTNSPYNFLDNSDSI